MLLQTPETAFSKLSPQRYSSVRNTMIFCLAVGTISLPHRLMMFPGSLGNPPPEVVTNNGTCPAFTDRYIDLYIACLTNSTTCHEQRHARQIQVTIQRKGFDLGKYGVAPCRPCETVVDYCASAIFCTPKSSRLLVCYAALIDVLGSSHLKHQVAALSVDCTQD